MKRENLEKANKLAMRLECVRKMLEACAYFRGGELLVSHSSYAVVESEGSPLALSVEKADVKAWLECEEQRVMETLRSLGVEL